MKPVLLIVAYLVLGGAGIAGAARWLERPKPAASAAASASTAFDYPTVVPAAGADAADWKAGHLDGWKWCVMHIREGAPLRDDAALRGLCPPDANRTAAFLAGYHAALDRFDALVSAEGAADARTEVLRQLKAKPRLHDLRVVAPPP